VQLGGALTRKKVQIMRASAASGSGSPGGHAGTMRTVSGGKRGRTMPSSPPCAPASVPDVYLRARKPFWVSSKVTILQWELRKHVGTAKCKWQVTTGTFNDKL